MKHLKYFSVFMLCTLATSTMPVSTSSPHMPKALKSQIAELLASLKNDDVVALKAFIKKYPKPAQFQWNETYSNLPWPVETQTPLSAAAWLGAHKCLKYLLKNNIGQIKDSFNIPSSRGFTAVHYAQNPPKKRLYKHQTDANYKKIVKILQKHGETK